MLPFARRELLQLREAAWSWKHPDKISFRGFFTLACWKAPVLLTMIFAVCSPSISLYPFALLGPFPWLSLAHIVTVVMPGDFTPSFSLRLYDWCLFFRVSFLWHLIYATPLSFQTHSHLPNTHSLSWSKYDAYFLLESEYSLCILHLSARLSNYYSAMGLSWQ